MGKDECIFCKIVTGNTPSYKVWEDKKHLAFLSIFPNTEGVTVVLPKKHYGSYFADVPEKVAIELVKASRKVSKLIDSKIKDVGRTAMVFEGFGVNHLHTKLFQMHGTKKNKEWKPITSKNNNFLKKYEGFISTNDCNKMSKSELERVWKTLKE